MDSVKKTFDDTVASLADSLKNVKNSVINGTTSKLQNSADSAVSTVYENTSNAVSAVASRAERFVDTCAAHSANAVEQCHSVEDEFFGTLKDGLRVCVLNPIPSIAAGISLSIVLFPGPRLWLVRRIAGMVQSEEAIYRSADAKLENLVKTIEARSKETAVLEASTKTLAREKQNIQSKLSSTASQLSGLAKQAKRAQYEAEGLKAMLRQLPGRQALHLRSQLAKVESTAEAQSSSIAQSLKQARQALK
mmetsp:Transcript_35316/g.67522  ORF Transcript_35316/g.67522 Transcript_35316/m.67522 type:complete len:249 (-) Transcript_35316:246-992(-)|eukprot:CAMPEP_0114266556 /NCGR_PEP_ID=MMETSP0058-20121206/24688_1 /TAXON_ID=36894 /ORGANISM="Pyramimonas parkeae, CCMP726" /LENGTH=248 /DNA_ID=CAMNT_0001384075 /DNA_START=23 /DNA_END=769 /DNA_ORIENTATION=+